MKDRSREMMLRKIQETDFALYETTLFLDTHPEDEKMLCLHKQLAEKSRELKERYQAQYGPLTPAENMGNTWQWICGPWPWEM